MYYENNWHLPSLTESCDSKKEIEEDMTDCDSNEDSSLSLKSKNPEQPSFISLSAILYYKTKE
ncbi:21911_t:CDS:2 [Entrophospora sp. SA101]|nr:21911_t:CDS:2 [Entrophospora sp. SA101]